MTVAVALEHTTVKLSILTIARSVLPRSCYHNRGQPVNMTALCWLEAGKRGERNKGWWDRRGGCITMDLNVSA